MLTPSRSKVYNIVGWHLNLSIVAIISQLVLSQIQLLCKLTCQGPHLSDAFTEVLFFKDQPIIIELRKTGSGLTLIAKLWPVLEQQWL